MNDRSKREPTEERAREATRKIRDYLSQPATPAELRTIAHQDQLGARLRGMTDQEREEVIRNLAEDNQLDLEAARDWVRRLME